eukprot:TRINITY_DN31177_c0_g2_i1.p1 TRINITY_DN31177_c0_g2~~TRINITY_DN31177_c0_g2_i1.p1  ORF type:complete len:660 (+),score=47.96 TRINITY_DN31177_c0_g2_i1:88-2067(+)
MCACFLRCAASAPGNDGSPEGGDLTGRRMGPSRFCEAAALPPERHETAVPRVLGAQERRAIAGFGKSLFASRDPASIDFACNSSSLTRPSRRLKRVLRAGVPDCWKAYTWLHASGAQEFADRLAWKYGITAAESDVNSPALAQWYARQLANVFGEGFIPESFASGLSGRAPIFSVGTKGWKGQPPFASLLEDCSPQLLRLVTPEGICAVKRVLWVLHSMWASGRDQSFAPWVPQLALALILFCEEHEVCAILWCLLERGSCSNADAVRSFLFCDVDGLVRASRQLLAMVGRDNGKQRAALERLASLDMDLESFTSYALKDLLASALPARAFVRLLSAVLCEGWKAGGRYMAAWLSWAADAGAIDELAPDLEAKLFTETVHLSGRTLDNVCQTAFQLTWRSRRRPCGAPGHAYPSYLERSSHLDCFAWPRFETNDSEAVPEDSVFGNPSKFVSHAAFVTLWSGPLPQLLRHRRLRLVFSCGKDGYNLTTLAQRCETLSTAEDGDIPMLFFVSTDRCGVLGGFAPMLLRPTGGGYISHTVALDDAFVFCFPGAEKNSTVPGRSGKSEARANKGEPVRTFHPMSTYAWSGANQQLFSLTSAGLLFGGDLPAIALDSELLHGNTQPCKTFNSPALSMSAGGDSTALTAPKSVADHGNPTSSST